MVVSVVGTSPAKDAQLAPVVDNAIHRINHYPLDIAIGFAITYPVDSDLSSGKHYPSFEQLGPVLQVLKSEAGCCTL